MSNKALREAVKIVMMEMGYEWKDAWCVWYKSGEKVNEAEALAMCKDLNKMAEIWANIEASATDLHGEALKQVAIYEYSFTQAVLRNDKEAALMATAAALEAEKG